MRYAAQPYRILSIIILLLAPFCAQAQTPVNNLVAPKTQFLNNSGVPLASGCVFTYTTGTSTPLATYTDSTGATPNANPVILDAGGFASIWLAVGSTYRIKVVTVGGVNCSTGAQQYQIDGISGSCLVGSSCVTTSANNAFTGNNTHSGTETFSGTVNLNSTVNVTGGLTVSGGIFNATAGITTTTLSASGLSTLAAATLSGVLTPNAGISTTTLAASGQITSTVATGTAPLVIASTTNVPNLNASSLNGATFAAPGAVGGTTPSSGAFTSITCKNFETIRCVDTNTMATVWGQSDLGAAINAARDDIGITNAGTIYVTGPSVNFATGINCDNCTGGIKIVGQASPNGGASAGVAMNYTGTGSPVSARDSLGFQLSHMHITWNNAAFAGPVVKLGAVGETDFAEIDHNVFNSVAPGANAPIVIDLDKTTRSKISFNVLAGYVIGIRGAASGTSFSVVNWIEKNNFSSSTGTAVTAHIQNPGIAPTIQSNIFEMGTAAGTPAIINCTATSTNLLQGASVLGNTAQDPGTGTWTYITGCAYKGLSFAGGNEWSGTANTTFLDSAAGSQGLVVKGQKFDTFALLFKNFSNASLVDVGENSESAVTTEFDSSPVSGRVLDTTGHIRQFTPVPTCSQTGGGTGATCSVQAGSTDYSGLMFINTGTTPGASGTITLTFSSAFVGTAPSCTMNLNQGGAAAWNTRATVMPTALSLSAPAANWDNNAVTLTGSTSSGYAVNYTCGPR